MGVSMRRLAGFELRQPQDDIDLETARFDVHQRKSGISNVGGWKLKLHCRNLGGQDELGFRD
jgi:hypothetical protein